VNPGRVLITGANGHLGRRLLTRLAGHRPLRAVVRSATAAATLARSVDRAIDTCIVDYTDAAAMAAAAQGCDVAVHLVGILKETAANRYVDAHEATCRALASAAALAGLSKIVYLSILGSKPEARNACLASKGRAERVLLDGPVPALVLRVPMVLGEDDYASRALSARARSRFAVTLRASSREQPIYAGDVIEAIVAALATAELAGVALDLAGPESLTRGDLIRRAGAVIGATPKVLSLPVWPGLAAAWLLERLSSDPPVTPAMLGVLDHDDVSDPRPTLDRLGIRLTPLDDTLRCVIQGPDA